MALTQAHLALSDSRAPDRLARYYDPNSPYAGSTFLDINPNPDFEIAASDPWALSTLSMDVPPLHGRQLIEPGHLEAHVRRGLRALSPTRPLTDIDTATATTMRELYDTIRTGLPPLGKNTETNQWVFASKLCARKRPELFPVRDSVVSKYLLDVKGPRRRRQRWGQFNVDIPIIAFVITTPSVGQHLNALREPLRADAPTHDSTGPTYACSTSCCGLTRLHRVSSPYPPPRTIFRSRRTEEPPCHLPLPPTTSAPGSSSATPTTSGT